LIFNLLEFNVKIKKKYNFIFIVLLIDKTKFNFLMGNFLKCKCKKKIFKFISEKKSNNKYSQITINSDINAITKNERHVEDNNNKKKGKYDLTLAMLIKNVLEEIADVKELHSKGAIFMSESVGRPRDIYETIENIAPSK
jgi:hypothetical protein